MSAKLKITPYQSITVVRSTDAALELDATWGAGGHRPPKQLHPAQEERFEVLSGALQARIEGVDRTYRAGESFVIPAGAVHAVWNDGEDEARAVWRTVPGLRTLELFESIGALYREGRVPEDEMPGLLVWATLLDEYRDVLRLAAKPAGLVRGAFAALAQIGRRRGYGPRPRALARA